MILYCHPQNVCLVYRDEEEGWDYYGNDVDYVEDGTKEQCRRLCDENQDCKVWLFIGKKILKY